MTKEEDELTMRFLYDKIKANQKKIERLERVLFQQGILQ